MQRFHSSLLILLLFFFSLVCSPFLFVFATSKDVGINGLDLALAELPQDLQPSPSESSSSFSSSSSSSSSSSLPVDNSSQDEITTQVGDGEFVIRLPEPSPGVPGIPAPLSSNDPVSVVLKVYRHGEFKNVLLDTISKISHLVKKAKELFVDEKIERIVSRTGEPVTSISSLKRLLNGTSELMLIALASVKEEHFIWPALNVGDEVHLTVEGRPITVRTLSTRPRIFEIDNFMDSDECDHIVKKAQTFGMMRSRVGVNVDAGGISASFRTSSQLWVGPSSKNDDKVFLGIRKRVFNLTKLPSNLAEDTQVVYYDTNQHYYAHHDYTDRQIAIHDPYIQGGGNRLVTVLYYLNDVPEGGETAFPYVNSDLCPFTKPLEDKAQSCVQGLKIRPKKGGAAMFYSLQEDGHMDGNTDIYSLHAGCDVWKGEKWLANQWIRNKAVDGRIM